MYFFSTPALVEVVQMALEAAWGLLFSSRFSLKEFHFYHQFCEWCKNKTREMKDDLFQNCGHLSRRI